MERNLCADPADLNCRIRRSRCRIGKCEFSARLLLLPPLTCLPSIPRSRSAAPYDFSLSVTTAFGRKPCFFNNRRRSFEAARLFLRDWTSTSSTSPSLSTARQRYTRLPLIDANTSSRCHRASARDRVCPQLSRISQTELQRSTPDCFIAHINAAF